MAVCDIDCLRVACEGCTAAAVSVGHMQAHHLVACQGDGESIMLVSGVYQVHDGVTDVRAQRTHAHQLIPSQPAGSNTDWVGRQ
jgi:hypothetical protein